MTFEYVSNIGMELHIYIYTHTHTYSESSTSHTLTSSVRTAVECGQWGGWKAINEAILNTY